LPLGSTALKAVSSVRLNIYDVITPNVAVYLDVCSPTQRLITFEPIEPYIGFNAGQADLNGDGLPEYLAVVGVPTLATLTGPQGTFNKRVVSTTHVKPGGEEYPVMHLGTLSGQPRFLTLAACEHQSTWTNCLVLEKLDTEQIMSDSTTLTLQTVAVNDGSTANFELSRMFVFPNVWYLPRIDGSMWVITADTIVSEQLLLQN